MEITVISTETIEPSSPTPDHLRHLKLSLIDQNSIFIRVLFFYSAHGDPHRFQTTNTSHRLKRSLSEALTEFYPLAGRLNGQDSIHCNDSGLEYIEARVKPPLALGQLLACPRAEELTRLVPHEEYNESTGFNGLSAVQVTVFEQCGGMAIGVSVSHCVADASSVATFVNRWADIARGDEKLKFPSTGFDCSSLFPPVDPVPAPVLYNDDNAEAVVSKPQPKFKFVTRRFVFRQTKIDALRAMYTYESPTRVEAVSALVLMCLLNTIDSPSPKPIVLCMGINLRSRLNPPLPAHYFGNLALPGKFERINPKSSLNDLGRQIRGIIRAINSDYLDKLRADNTVLERQLKLFVDNNIQIVPTTSWCRFPWYEADVGWGRPTWVAPVYLSYLESFMLVDAKNGDGIEAWVTLKEQDMAEFESDDRLVEFACPNPVVHESP